MKQYQFLYWIGDYDEKGMRARIEKARTVKAACKKFNRFLSRKRKVEIEYIDYETMSEGKYIDISEHFPNYF